MEINKITDAEVESSDVFESLDFKFNEDAMSLMFKSFTDSLYSNKIGSIVREIVSNAADANQENNSTKPVEIHLESLLTDSLELTVKDYGKGLSPDLIKNTYTQYFASTKRNTNEQIGGWGIGAKTPLSYAKSFYLITHHEDKKYKYLVSRGEVAPQINLIFTEDSTDIGTSVVINFKKEDLDTLTAELQHQLKYFDNINYYGCSIDNNYKLYYFNNFIVRPGNNQLEISLGRVCYPIMESVVQEAVLEIEKLTFNNVSKSLNASGLSALPIALKFEIGELDVTLSREQLEYTDKTKSAIKSRILAAIKELDKLVALNDKTVKNLEHFLEVGAGNASEGNYIKLEDETYFSLYPSNKENDGHRRRRWVYPVFREPEVIIKSFSSEDNVFLASKLSSIGYFINFTQRTVNYGKPTSVKKNVNKLYRLASKSIIEFINSLEDTEVLLLDEKVNRNKLLYLANNGLAENDSTYDKTEYTIICAEVNNKDESYRSVKFPDPEVFNEVLALLNKKLTVLSDIGIPEDWLTKYKQTHANVKKAIDNTKINVIDTRYGRRLKLSIQELRSKNNLVVYGTQDNRAALDKVQYLFKRIEIKCDVYVCSIDNLHYFDNNPKFIYIEDINNYLQKKFINAYVMDKVRALYVTDQYHFYNNHFKNSINTLGKNLKILDQYRCKNLNKYDYILSSLDIPGTISLDEYECIFIHSNQSYDIIKILKNVTEELYQVYDAIYPTNKILYKLINHKK